MWQFMRVKPDPNGSLMTPFHGWYRSITILFGLQSALGMFRKAIELLMVTKQLQLPSKLL